MRSQNIAWSVTSTLGGNMYGVQYIHWDALRTIFYGCVESYQENQQTGTYWSFSTFSQFSARLGRNWLEQMAIVRIHSGQYSVRRPALQASWISQEEILSRFVSQDLVNVSCYPRKHCSVQLASTSFLLLFLIPTMLVLQQKKQTRRISAGWCHPLCLPQRRRDKPNWWLFATNGFDRWHFLVRSELWMEKINQNNRTFFIHSCISYKCTPYSLANSTLWGLF